MTNSNRIYMIAGEHLGWISATGSRGLDGLSNIFLQSRAIFESHKEPQRSFNRGPSNVSIFQSDLWVVSLCVRILVTKRGFVRTLTSPSLCWDSKFMLLTNLLIIIISLVDAEWTANEEARLKPKAEPYTYYARYDEVSANW